MKTPDADLERALCNWARWKVSEGTSIVSSLAHGPVLEERSPWETAPPPIINGEAMEMDRIIESLPGRYSEVIRVRYCMQLDYRAAARRCRCVPQTYYNRLETAWGLIRTALVERRAAAARVVAMHRAAYETARKLRYAY